MLLGSLHSDLFGLVLEHLDIADVVLFGSVSHSASRTVYGNGGASDVANVLWKHVDFGRVKLARASRLSDADLGRFLRRIEAPSRTESLVLTGCTGLRTGVGLTIFRYSSALRRIDLRVNHTPNDYWSDGPVTTSAFEEGCFLPLLAAAASAESNLDTVIFRKWDLRNGGANFYTRHTPEIRRFLREFRRLVQGRVMRSGRLCDCCREPIVPHGQSNDGDVEEASEPFLTDCFKCGKSSCGAESCPDLDLCKCCYRTICSSCEPPLKQCEDHESCQSRFCKGCVDDALVCCANGCHIECHECHDIRQCFVGGMVQCEGCNDTYCAYGGCCGAELCTCHDDGISKGYYCKSCRSISRCSYCDYDTVCDDCRPGTTFENAEAGENVCRTCAKDLGDVCEICKKSFLKSNGYCEFDVDIETCAGCGKSFCTAFGDKAGGCMKMEFTCEFCWSIHCLECFAKLPPSMKDQDEGKRDCGCRAKQKRRV